MIRKKVLFVCIHNSARSQMAEELLRYLANDRFDVQSAGIEPGHLNPLVVEVLKEEGIDISTKATQSVNDLIDAGKKYDYVITVCDETSAERCPSIPGEHTKEHWTFTDPSLFTGSNEEKIILIRDVKEEIKIKLDEWVKCIKLEIKGNGQ